MAGLIGVSKSGYLSMLPAHVALTELLDVVPKQAARWQD
jgi:hypothetical protein